MDYGSAIEDALYLKGMYEFLPMQLGDVEKTEDDSKKLEDIIGFSPKTDIKIGINKFVDWYRLYYEIN